MNFLKCNIVKNGAPLAMAGLWEQWQSEEGRLMESCAIITTEADNVFQPIYHRMPVILARDQFITWLDPENHEITKLQSNQLALNSHIIT